MPSSDLSETGIADADASGLVELTSLTRLDLSGTEITDACASSSKGLPSLNKLDLSRTKVTPVGVAALCKARAQLRITR